MDHSVVISLGSFERASDIRRTACRCSGGRQVNLPPRPAGHRLLSCLQYQEMPPLIRATNE
jgi:hypothetical protein